MLKLNNEERLILMLSRVGHSSKNLQSIQLLKAHINWDILLKIAAKNDVLSLVCRHLSETERVPNAIRQKLLNAYYHTVRHNILNATEMIRVLTKLRNEGVEAIPLKGAIASELIFGDPGLYTSSDLDILVMPSDLNKAGAILVQAGYRKHEEIHEIDLLTDHYHLLFSRGIHHLELHWNLVKRYYKIPPEFWWEDRCMTHYEGIPINILSPEKYILYTVFRLFDHGFRPLKFFVLIAEIINKNRNEINWHKLLSFSKKYKMERLMIFTLRMLRDILGTEIPEAVLKRRVTGYNTVRNIIITGLFRQIDRPHLRMLFYTLLLDSPYDFLKILVRRFFPGIGEIRLRYGLPLNSRKVYVYYLLNPFMIFIKRRWKGFSDETVNR